MTMNRRDHFSRLVHRCGARRAAILLALIVQLAAPVPAFSDQIFEAAWRGNLEKVQRLLQNNPGFALEKDKKGDTALILAAAEGHSAVVELLLANKADVNARNGNDDTALLLAVSKGHKDVAGLLLANKADVDARNRSGDTPLLLAVVKGNRDVADLLLNNKADVNARNKNDDTALLLAVSNGYKDVAGLLMANKADVDARNSNGDTPLLLASVKGYGDVAELLLKSGADTNAKNKKGDTALIWAVSTGHKDIAEQLLAHQADVAAKSNNGTTALHLAEFKHDEEIAELLRQRMSAEQLAAEPPAPLAAKSESELWAAKLASVACQPIKSLGTHTIAPDCQAYLGDAHSPQDVAHLHLKGVIPSKLNGKWIDVCIPKMMSVGANRDFECAIPKTIDLLPGEYTISFGPKLRFVGVLHSDLVEVTFHAVAGKSYVTHRIIQKGGSIQYSQGVKAYETEWDVEILEGS